VYVCVHFPRHSSIDGLIVNGVFHSANVGFISHAGTRNPLENSFRTEIRFGSIRVRHHLLLAKNHCRKIANAIIIWYKRMSVNTTEIVVCNVGGDWRATIRAFVAGDWRATIRAFVWQAPICRRKSSEKRGVCYKPDGETYYNIMCNLLVVGYLCAIYRYCVYCRYTRFYR